LRELIGRRPSGRRLIQFHDQQRKVMKKVSSHQSFILEHNGLTYERERCLSTGLVMWARLAPAERFDQWSTTYKVSTPDIIDLELEYRKFNPKAAGHIPVIDQPLTLDNHATRMA